MTDPKSIQDYSGIIQGPSGHQNTSKNIIKPTWELRGSSGKFSQNYLKNPHLVSRLTPQILKFPMLAHVLPAAGLSGDFK